MRRPGSPDPQPARSSTGWMETPPNPRPVRIASACSRFRPRPANKPKIHPGQSELLQLAPGFGQSELLQLAPGFAQGQRINQRSTLDRDRVVIPLSDLDCHGEMQFYTVTGIPGALYSEKAAALDILHRIAVYRDAGTLRPAGNA